jgi:chromosome segregation ATPase
MQILKQVLRTGTDTVTDVETLRTRHGDAARKVAQGAAEIETLTANVQKLRLDRARLIDQRDTDEGVDLFEPLRKVEGALTSAQRRHDDLVDVLQVRQENVSMLEAQVRAAERAAAPGRMKALAREHGELRDDLRTEATVIKALADKIIASEAAMQQVFHLHGITAENVLVIEGLATTAQATATEILGRLDWQDRQLELGDELAVKLEQDRAEVDRRNGELGYPLYVSPGVNYFQDGWVDETTEERTARASG